MITKVKWILGISMVFFLILATNYLDRNNFRQVQESIETLFADRIVAQDIVFEMSMIHHEKLQLMPVSPVQFPVEAQQSLNKKMSDWIQAFSETKLTPKEENLFNDLQTDFKKVSAIETQMQTQSDVATLQAYQLALKELNDSIYTLSKFQVEEGRRQLMIGKKAIGSINMLKNLEFYVLLILAILIQILLIYKPKQS